MKNLEELKGEYFAIEVKNNETAEIEKQLKDAGYSPYEKWNNMLNKDEITYVLVYQHLKYEFHNHSGGAQIITL